MSEVKLKIGKIHCDNCYELIKDILIEDLEAINVEFKEDVATIKYDAKKTNVDKIKQAIIEAGYLII